MRTSKSICADVLKASYKDNGVLIELHKTGAKHFISLENGATGAIEVSQGYFALDQAQTVFSVLVCRLADGWDFAALVDLMNS